jgi:lysozyme
MAHVSDEGLTLIKNQEALRLEAYQDSNGIWTIGYGHTGKVEGKSVGPGMKITHDQANVLLAGDLAIYEKAVENAIQRPATQAQFDAMVSLCFNIGASAFRESSVLRFFNLGKFDSAAKAFSLWIRDNDSIEEGLVYRRAAEIVRFMGGHV